MENVTLYDRGELPDTEEGRAFKEACEGVLKVHAEEKSAQDASGAAAEGKKGGNTVRMVVNYKISVTVV